MPWGIKNTLRRELWWFLAHLCVLIYVSLPVFVVASTRPHISCCTSTVTTRISILLANTEAQTLLKGFYQILRSMWPVVQQCFLLLWNCVRRSSDLWAIDLVPQYSALTQEGDMQASLQDRRQTKVHNEDKVTQTLNSLRSTWVLKWVDIKKTLVLASQMWGRSPFFCFISLQITNLWFQSDTVRKRTRHLFLIFNFLQPI